MPERRVCELRTVHSQGRSIGPHRLGPVVLEVCSRWPERRPPLAVPPFEDQFLFRKIDEKTYLFEGKILLNDFCKVFEIEEDLFKDVRGESETLAGLILELTGDIPQKDQIIKFGNFVFRIESADRRRIKEIRVEINKDDGKIQEI